MLIGFTGSHGTGKTTTAKIVAAVMNGTALLSSSRTVHDAGLPINKEATRLTQMMITVARSNQAHDYSRLPGVWVADRTPLDSVAYTRYQMDHVWENEPGLDRVYWNYTVDMTLAAITKYDKLFYFPPLDSVEDDGVRIGDRDYQIIINDRIKNLLETWGIRHLEVPNGTPLERAHFIQAACEIMV